MIHQTPFVNEEVKSHFDEVAGDYDYWKRKNWYYYQELKNIAAEHSAKNKNVLDAGCGTGTILRSLEIQRGTGIDVSPEMIKIAALQQKEYPHLRFFVSDIESLDAKEKYDLILLFDVVEHLPNVESALKALRRVSTEHAQVLVTMANPLWEPVLMLAEKFHQKMPEGPHNRISNESLITIAENCGFKLIDRQHRLLFPKYIPLVSFVLNSVVGRLPLVNKLSFIEVFIFERSI